MYIYLSSQQSIGIYPNNTATDFTIDLRTPLFLENPQEWEIGLIEAEVPFLVDPRTTLSSNFLILCDTVDYSLINGFNAQILRRIPFPLETPTATTLLTGTVVNNIPPQASTVDIINIKAVPSTSVFYIFDTPLYIPCIKGLIENIHITVKALDLENLELTTEPMYITLELRKKFINREYAQY